MWNHDGTSQWYCFEQLFILSWSRQSVWDPFNIGIMSWAKNKSKQANWFYRLSLEPSKYNQAQIYLLRPSCLFCCFFLPYIFSIIPLCWSLLTLLSRYPADLGVICGMMTAPFQSSSSNPPPPLSRKLLIKHKQTTRELARLLLSSSLF